MSVPLFDPAGVRAHDAATEDAAIASAGPSGLAAPQREVTFLHTADWQLGMTRHFLPRDAQATYDAAREQVVIEIGRLAGSVGAEFVVVCGDVFDDPRVSTRIIRRTLDALGAYPVPVYLLPGNHDPLDGSSVYRSATFVNACPDNVHVLDRAGAVRVRDGVTLVAAPWTTKQPDGDLVGDQLSRLAPSDDLRIVVGHGGVDTFAPSADPAVVASSSMAAAVDSGLVDYIALGDRHSASAVGDSQRIWYSGAPEVTAFDHVETNSGQVLEVTLRRGPETDVRVTEHTVGQWTFTSIEQDVDGAADLAELRERLAELPNKARTVVKLGLTGTLGLADQAEFEELVAEFGDHFAALYLWTRKHRLTVVADPSDVASLGLQGYAAQAAEELAQRAKSGDEEEAEAAHSALSLLFRLAGNGDRKAARA